MSLFETADFSLVARPLLLLSSSIIARLLFPSDTLLLCLLDGLMDYDLVYAYLIIGNASFVANGANCDTCFTISYSSFYTLLALLGDDSMSGS